jgi:hypothetical protein
VLLTGSRPPGIYIYRCNIYDNFSLIKVGIKTRGDGRKSIDEIQKSFNNKNIPNFAGLLFALFVISFSARN